ncbi:nucleotide exchange factor GrpE [Rummeliibacillus suwonensis]|uniref:nucleotide exchange factor GrpE n=1 Tax=Rummeliibacillus suwonensis TaxID=1306154 RepID=UPI001AAFC712|nr:nucleotide exchange factor GrpE [Rummeliibacillus suwonensis]MBO2534907.1 nucleotide exchange factor GrpE [Rummeliibacillus suwonensis]
MSQAKEEKDQLVNNEEATTEETIIEETTEETSVEETVAEDKDTAKEDESDELALLKEKLEKEEERYLRLLADFDNLKRRNQIDRVAQEKYRAQNLLTDLLPVLDNFERALQVEATTEDAKSMKQGIEMVYRSLVEATTKEGLEPIATENVPFDPNIHHAVMQEKDDTKESGIVLQELQKGYMLKDRVLRPAMVKVNE